MLKIRPGGWCWIGLAAGVTVADLALVLSDNKTMSVVFGDALQHPTKRWPVLAAWTILTIHLHAVYMPDWVRKLDPIGGSARIVRARKNAGKSTPSVST